MASNRSNLALDEQSFQGLLAAAFTIQEHNDRANAGQDFPDPPASALPKTEPAKCSHCGTTLSSAGAPCTNCADGLRPGERLQRNWASMWLMSQDLKSGTPDGNHEDDLPLSPGDPGRVRARSPEPEVVISAAEAERTEPWPVSPEKRTGRSDISAHASTNDSGNGNSYSAGRTPQPQAALAAWPVGSTTAVDSNGFSADAPSQEHEDEILMGSEEELLGEPEATLAESEEPIAAHPERSRLKLRFQRADLYLGLAILVAALALLWPTGSSHAPKLPMWERILIAVGIAEEPPTVTHFHGDPDLKVWVDTHTALYYCPGDDLYGKSPGGHYSTQRDAQSDRFEPAERSVCVE